MTKAYKIYMTKSHEVARLLEKALMVDVGKDGIVEVLTGAVLDRAEFIPEIYDETEYFYCAAIRKSDNPGYELIFA